MSKFTIACEKQLTLQIVKILNPKAITSKTKSQKTEHL